MHCLQVTAISLLSFALGVSALPLSVYTPPPSSSPRLVRRKVISYSVVPIDGDSTTSIPTTTTEFRTVTETTSSTSRETTTLMKETAKPTTTTDTVVSVKEVASTTYTQPTVSPSTTPSSSQTPMTIMVSATYEPSSTAAPASPSSAATSTWSVEAPTSTPSGTNSEYGSQVSSTAQATRSLSSTSTSAYSASEASNTSKLSVDHSATSTLIVGPTPISSQSANSGQWQYSYTLWNQTAVGYMSVSSLQGPTSSLTAITTIALPQIATTGQLTSAEATTTLEYRSYSTPTTYGTSSTLSACASSTSLPRLPPLNGPAEDSTNVPKMLPPVHEHPTGPA